MSKRDRIFFVLFLAYLGLVVWCCFGNFGSMPNVQREMFGIPTDKVVHFVMFLPFEGLYAEVVNMELMEICQRDYKIMIAGPSTLAALLNSLQMGFRTLAIQKRSTEVWGVLGQVKGEFDKFADVLASAQQRINQANAELDKLIGVRTRSIQKTLSGMQKLSDPDEEEQGGWLP